MRKKIVWGTLLLITIFVCTYAFYRTYGLQEITSLLVENELRHQKKEKVLGIFHPEKDLDSEKFPSLRHYTLDLYNTRKLDFSNSEIAQLHDSVPFLLTVNIWNRDLFRKEETGNYQEETKILFSSILENKEKVFIRWDPEPEVPTDLFPWQDSRSYHENFERVQNFFDREFPKAQIVWGVAGYPGVLDVYPGDNSVDLTSITLRSNSEKQLNAYPQLPLEQSFMRKLHRLRFLDKPVLILAQDDIAFNESWIETAQKKYEQEKEVIYSEENFRRFPPDTRPKNEKLLIGLYEYQPNLVVSEKEALDVEHVFLDFANIRDNTFKEKIQQVFSRGHDLILSIEPWEGVDGKRDEEVLQHVLEGMYDPEFENLFSYLSAIDRTVYLRFAHEMEIPVTRYTWQSKDPLVYVKAFRYFMSFAGSDHKHIKKVWGPAGDRGSIEWWPGDDMVDYISIAIYGLPDKNITDPNKQESFQTIYKRKKWRMRFVNKPIFITEFGVKGNEEYQNNWLLEAAETINSSPEIAGINYFNMTDTPKAWGEIKPPDWSISKESFYNFLSALERTSTSAGETQ